MTTFRDSKILKSDTLRGLEIRIKNFRDEWRKGNITVGAISQIEEYGKKIFIVPISAHYNDGWYGD